MITPLSFEDLSPSACDAADDNTADCRIPYDRKSACKWLSLRPQPRHAAALSIAELVQCRAYAATALYSRSARNQAQF
jgi:hypothetical protein